jgi:hypothetical protein
VKSSYASHITLIFIIEDWLLYVRNLSFSSYPVLTDGPFLAQIERLRSRTFAGAASLLLDTSEPDKYHYHATLYMLRDVRQRVLVAVLLESTLGASLLQAIAHPWHACPS